MPLGDRLSRASGRGAFPACWSTHGFTEHLFGLCTLLGIAMSTVPRSEKTAAAVVNLPFVALQFISGVFVQYNSLPSGLRTIASIFPLKWLAQGFRSVFLPDSFLVAEPGGSWQHPAMALVLAGWCIAGFVLCRVSFRWGTER